MNQRTLARAAAAAAALATLSVAFAAPPGGIRPEERALLPNWCNAVQGWLEKPGAQEEYRRLVASYGKGWTHMHHYCWALVDLGRLDRQAGRRSGTRGNFSAAIGNIDYVLRNTEPGFPPRVEILTRKARALARHGTAQAAADTASQLVAEWPQHADGYVILADLLLKAGRRDQATRVLAQGSEKVTDKERFEKLKATLKLD